MQLTEETILDLINKSIENAFMQFEEKFEKNMSSRMNIMSNSFEYIVKALESSGIATNNIDKGKITWQTDMKNIIYELINIDNISFPSYNSVLKRIYIKMRNVYGIVIDQLRKEYRDKYGLDHNPDALDAISDDAVSRKVFESTLRGLFPTGYWSCKSGVIDDEYIEYKGANETQIERVMKIIMPLASKNRDSSEEFEETFNKVYKRMDCCWGNLQTRYKNINNTVEDPDKIILVATNPNVFRKFKRCVRQLLDE